MTASSERTEHLALLGEMMLGIVVEREALEAELAALMVVAEIQSDFPSERRDGVKNGAAGWCEQCPRCSEQGCSGYR